MDKYVICTDVRGDEAEATREAVWGVVVVNPVMKHALLPGLKRVRRLSAALLAHSCLVEQPCLRLLTPLGGGSRVAVRKLLASSPAARDAQIDENAVLGRTAFPCSREAALGAPEVPA